MQQLSDRIIIRPIYGDCDRMGVLYNANYLRFFEQGRGEMMRKTGLTYDQFEKMGYIMPVARINVRFIKPILYDEEIILETTVKAYDRFKVTFEYKMLKKGKIKAKGESVHPVVDIKGKLIELPEFFRDILDGKPYTKSG